MGGKAKRKPCDNHLVERIAYTFGDRPDVVQKRMFGGVAFMVRGHMTAGVSGDDLMLRVGKHAMTKSLSKAHVRPMDFTGVPLAGFVYVGKEAVATNLDLVKWLNRGLEFVQTLPEK